LPRIESVSGNPYGEGARESDQRTDIDPVAGKPVDVGPGMEQIRRALHVPFLHPHWHLVIVIITVETAHLDTVTRETALDEAVGRPERGTAVGERGWGRGRLRHGSLLVKSGGESSWAVEVPLPLPLAMVQPLGGLLTLT
jgi:hypothetical protein